MAEACTNLRAVTQAAIDTAKRQRTTFTHPAVPTPASPPAPAAVAPVVFVSAPMTKPVSPPRLTHAGPIPILPMPSSPTPFTVPAPAPAPVPAPAPPPAQAPAAMPMLPSLPPAIPPPSPRFTALVAEAASQARDGPTPAHVNALRAARVAMDEARAQPQPQPQPQPQGQPQPQPQGQPQGQKRARDEGVTGTDLTAEYLCFFADALWTPQVRIDQSTIGAFLVAMNSIISNVQLEQTLRASLAQLRARIQAQYDIVRSLYRAAPDVVTDADRRPAVDELLMLMSYFTARVHVGTPLWYRQQPATAVHCTVTL